MISTNSNILVKIHFRQKITIQAIGKDGKYNQVPKINNGINKDGMGM